MPHRSTDKHQDASRSEQYCWLGLEYFCEEKWFQFFVKKGKAKRMEINKFPKESFTSGAWCRKNATIWNNGCSENVLAFQNGLPLHRLLVLLYEKGPFVSFSHDLLETLACNDFHGGGTHDQCCEDRSCFCRDYPVLLGRRGSKDC